MIHLNPNRSTYLIYLRLAAQSYCFDTYITCRLYLCDSLSFICNLIDISLFYISILGWSC